MGTAFVAFSAGLGPLSRCLPLANELNARGHRVQFHAIDKARGHMEAFGHQFVPIEVPPLPPTGVTRTTDYPNLSTYYSFLGYTDAAYAAVKVERWVAAIERARPDVVVSDCNLEAMIAARALRIPLVAISKSAFHPANQLLEGEPPQAENERVLQTLRGILVQYTIGVDLLRVEQLFAGDATMYTSVPELDPEPTGDVVYTGPIVWNGQRSDQVSDTERVRELRRTSHKFVTVYTGRMRDLVSDHAGSLMIELLAEVAKSAHATVLIGTGGLDDVPQFLAERTGANVFIMPWVPAEELYRSDLVIHHGGHGSCLGSLVHGAPTLILPTHAERKYNARQLTRIGMARSLDPRGASREALEALIAGMLEDATVRLTARRWADAIKARDYNA